MVITYMNDVCCNIYDIHSMSPLRPLRPLRPRPLRPLRPLRPRPLRPLRPQSPLRPLRPLCPLRPTSHVPPYTAGNTRKSDGSRLHSCGCSFRVYHFHNLPVPTVFTGLRICQNDVLQVGAREVSSGMSLPWEVLW